MKKLILVASLLGALVSPAFADSAATTQTAVIGAQVNEQVGFFNNGSNVAGISQGSLAVAGPSFSPFAAPGLATTNQSAVIGAQVNSQLGVGNSGSNVAGISQNSAAVALPAFPVLPVTPEPCIRCVK